MRIKMDEYVEREALSNFILGLTIVDLMVAQYADAVLTHIQQAPAADVAEVRHGRWVYGEDDNIQCSICGHDAYTEGDYRQVKTNYCPNCGARMGKEDEHEIG